MNMNKNEKLIISGLLVLIAVISVAFAGKALSSPLLTSKNVAILDEKIKNVMELSAVSAGASVAVSALPGDMATPIADKLADFSSYFVVILCALYLEKYLLTVTGYAVGVVLIPLACAGSLIWLWKNSGKASAFAARMLLLAAAVFYIIPVSIQISKLIDKTYDTSLQTTITESEKTVEEIEASDNLPILEQFTEAAKEKLDKAENMVTDFVDALAVMIVTSCVIPILVMLFFWLLIKSLFGVDPRTWAMKKLQG